MNIFYTIVKWIYGFLTKNSMESRITPGMKGASYGISKVKDFDLYDMLMEGENCWFWISEELAVVMLYGSTMDC